MSEHLPLGPGPRPTTGADLVARIATQARAHVAEAQRPVAEALVQRLSAQVDGADLAIDVDATGLRVDGIAEWESIEGLLPTRDADLTDTEVGDLRSLTARAHPVHVEGVPVDLGLTLEGARIAWVVAADGEAGLRLVDPDDAHPLRGHLRVEAPQDATVAAIRTVAEAMAAEQGLGLSDVAVRLDGDGPRTVHLEASARIRKGILGAPASATATLRVDEALRIHVEDLAITSSNVLVSGMLGLVRGRIEQATSEPIDLGAMLLAGVRVTDVRLEAGERLGVEARLG